MIDRTGKLSIAKVPKDTDEYSIEIWEEIALRLGRRAAEISRMASAIEDTELQQALAL